MRFPPERQVRSDACPWQSDDTPFRVLEKTMTMRTAFVALVLLGALSGCDDGF